MLENFRKALKDDLWKIINDDEVKERDINDFIFFVFYIFLEKKSFKLKDVFENAKFLKNEYEEILVESKDMAVMGDPIKAIKNIDKKFIEKIKPIMEVIENV